MIAISRFDRTLPLCSKTALRVKSLTRVLFESPGLKRRLEEWVESRSGHRGVKKVRAEEAWAVPKHVLKSLVVVEVWPDKKNVVVVGNGMQIKLRISSTGDLKLEDVLVSRFLFFMLHS